MIEMRRSSLAGLLSAGTAAYPAPVRQRLIIVNVLALLIFVASLNYALVYALTDFATYRLFVVFNLVLCALALLVPLGHRVNEIAGGLMVAGFEFVGLFVLTALLGRNSGIQLNYIIGAAVPFLCFGLNRIGLILAVVAGGFALHLVAWFAFPPEAAIIRADPLLLSNIYVFSAITVFGLSAATVYFAFRLKERAEAKTEALLRNMLPEPIAEALRENPSQEIAQNIEEATVLFADIAGFTGLAQRLGASRTVALLNDVFTRFDRIADELGLEKIKTIGDCYMVAGGIPDPRPDHAQRVAEMALRMQTVACDYAEAHAMAWRLRVGIASGPVLAGVIGRRKPSYDVWGDTVNLAARMESSGEPGRIHATAAFMDKLDDAFEGQCRGPIDIRDFGVHETWYLLARRTNSPPGTLAPGSSG